MENLMKEVLKMENKDGVDTGIPMEMYTKENGKMTSNKEKVQCGIQIKINMKGNGSKAKKMDGENIFTTMQLFMRETF